jgi:Protein of unknown function (DUF3102)
MTAPTKLSAAALSKNARLINEELAAIIEATETSAQHAITAGQILKACKDSVGHGEWKKWLGQNCPDISKRTASRYMLMAKHEQEVEKILEADGNRQRIADLSASALYSLIPKKPRTPSATTAERAAVVQEEAEPKSTKDEIQELLTRVDYDELFLVMKFTWDEDQIKKLADLVADHLKARTRAAEAEAQPAPQPELHRRQFAQGTA